MAKGPLPVNEDRLRAATQPSIARVLNRQMQFQPDEALRLLLDGERKPRGFRNAVRAGFWTWMLAPSEHHFVCNCMHNVLQVLSKKSVKIKQKEYGSLNKALVIEKVDLDSQWVNASISYIRAKSNSPIYHSNKYLASEIKKHIGLTKRTVESARFIHILHDVHRKYGRKYVQPSASRARALICEMEGKGGIKLTPSTLLRRYWQKQRASIAFIYAASTVKGADERSVLNNMADRKLPFLHHDRELEEIAGRAKWFSENILRTLRPSAREGIPEFAFPDSVPAVGFEAAALTDQELEVVRENAKDGRNKRLPDPWTNLRDV